jgi:hypothetical protein
VAQFPASGPTKNLKEITRIRSAPHQLVQSSELRHKNSPHHPLVTMEFTANEKTVKFTSSDNELFELPASIAKLSKLIQEQLEGFHSFFSSINFL